ncbi:MAG: hypothetical protein KDA61_07195, partial [Planctomycetales bacterium]|nr:hypothetical protein [Planctomycetales bacterium]
SDVAIALGSSFEGSSFEGSSFEGVQAETSRGRGDKVAAAALQQVSRSQRRQPHAAREHGRRAQNAAKDEAKQAAHRTLHIASGRTASSRAAKASRIAVISAYFTRADAVGDKRRNNPSTDDEKPTEVAAHVAKPT